jgi:hypothetical protein
MKGKDVPGAFRRSSLTKRNKQLPEMKSPVKTAREGKEVEKHRATSGVRPCAG